MPTVRSLFRPNFRAMLRHFSQSGPHQGRSRCESVCSYSRQLRLSWRVAVLRVPKLRVRRGLALNRVLQPSRSRIRYCRSKIKTDHALERLQDRAEEEEDVLNILD